MCADPGCDSPTDDSERGPAFECDDGFDNDGDGLIDYPNGDPQCVQANDPTEACGLLGIEPFLVIPLVRRLMKRGKQQRA